MSASDQLVLLERNEGLATITLNRPDHGNALSLELTTALQDLVNDVATNRSVRAVLLTGSGRFFSVGGDLEAFSAAKGGRGRLLGSVTARLNALLSNLVRMPKPVVVAVNGPAAGAGLGLAVAGDLVLASSKAHFTMAYTAVGLTPDGGTTTLLPRLIGTRLTQDLAFTNRRVSAEEAKSIGLIGEIVEPEALISRATELAGSLAAGPTAAFAATKRLLARGPEAPLETQLAAEARAIMVAADSRDAAEGIAAFLGKRPAAFTGGR